jgi:hypothetical protein
MLRISFFFEEGLPIVDVLLSGQFVVLFIKKEISNFSGEFFKQVFINTQGIVAKMFGDNYFFLHSFPF